MRPSSQVKSSSTHLANGTRNGMKNTLNECHNKISSFPISGTAVGGRRVEHLPRQPKVKGSSTNPANGTRNGMNIH